MDRVEIKIKGIVECHGKYLLVQKWYDDNIINPYKWEFVDSVLPHGARPEDAVIENIEVQTGISSTVKKIAYTWTYAVGDTSYVGIAFVCKTDNDIVILSDEYSSFIWVEPKKLNQYIEDAAMLQDISTYLNIKYEGAPDDNDDLELTIE